MYSIQEHEEPTMWKKIMWKFEWNTKKKYNFALLDNGLDNPHNLLIQK
jgi:hypothetical protein